MKFLKNSLASQKLFRIFKPPTSDESFEKKFECHSQKVFSLPKMAFSDWKFFSKVFVAHKVLMGDESFHEKIQRSFSKKFFEIFT